MVISIAGLMLALIGALRYSVRIMFLPFIVPLALAQPISTPPVEARIFDQKIDHTQSDSPTFKERYWVSQGYAKDENAPTVVYVCGEAPCSARWASPYADRWAEPLGAHVAAIEHRYYGESLPFTDFTTENLRFLTEDQALADIHTILLEMRNHEGFKGPFILVGGSYSAGLALHAREDFPELVSAAWVSSGPVKYSVDFSAYDTQMTKIMGENCADSLRKVIAAGESAVQDPARFAELRKKFLAPDLTNARDFLFGISDVAAGAVQYGMTKLLCDSFVSDDPVEDYAAFLKKMSDEDQYTMESYNFGTILDTSSSSPNAATRAYFYQECSEIGLFQTAAKDPRHSVRSSLIDHDYVVDGCERAFGRTFDTEEKTEALNRRYYDPLLRKDGPSHLYITAGALDPNNRFSRIPELQGGPDQGIVAALVADGAHCDDLNAGPKSPTSVQEAARKGLELLKEWME